MDYRVYRLYCAQKKIIDRTEGCNDNYSDDELNMLADMKLSEKLIDECEPKYLERYNMEQDMFKSFTEEQKDFICYQIGEWYLLWKEKMWVENHPNQHWLGRGKEDLKTMICGD